MEVRVTPEPFDLGAEAARFAARAGAAGAIVTFTGVVRDPGGLIAMEIEHYPGMTERSLAQVGQEAQDRWGLTAVLLLHRHGRLAPGEPIMMVATAAPHRAAAFAAAEFLMDYLKSRAPFWKREITGAGAAWVTAKASDEEALARWEPEG